MSFIRIDHPKKSPKIKNYTTSLLLPTHSAYDTNRLALPANDGTMRCFGIAAGVCPHFLSCACTSLHDQPILCWDFAIAINDDDNDRGELRYGRAHTFAGSGYFVYNRVERPQWSIRALVFALSHFALILASSKMTTNWLATECAG